MPIFNRSQKEAPKAYHFSEKEKKPAGWGEIVKSAIGPKKPEEIKNGKPVGWKGVLKSAFATKQTKDLAAELDKKPKKFFEEKKEWSVREMIWKEKQSSSAIPGTGGKRYTKEEKAKHLQELIPRKRFGEMFKKEEAKIILRELRKKEDGAKTGAEKIEINRKRRFWEDKWGMKGQY